MKPVTADRACFRIGGEPVCLNSGEFHYFRVPPRDWRRRMRLFKDAGGNTLATYVPWLIHEPDEERFVFGGGGSYDVERFLGMAAEEGLYVIVRPGPYQYSELRHDGLPGWLCTKYPELRARNLKGEAFRESSVSYLHPLFLEKVRRWFAEVCPRMARYTVSRGGSVALAQFDNELGGIHTWFGSLDYHPLTMGFGDPGGRWPLFLAARYGTVEALNRAWGTAFTSLAEARPIDSGSTGAPEEIRRLRDYFDFYLGTLAEYGVALSALMREHGIDVPLVHNSAGPAMNAWFRPLCERMGTAFLLGSDHYYTLGQEWAQNNPTPQYAVGVFFSLDMLRCLGYPPTVFELPGGSLSDWPPVTPGDARACYLTNVALGMKGSNYYIFTGGPNLPGTGTTSDVYDYGAAIGPRNEVRPLYRVQKQVGLFLQRNAWLAEAEREYDFRVGLDFDQVTSHHSWKARGPFAVSAPEAWTLVQRGLLSTAFCAGLSPAFVQLGADDWVEDVSTPLAVVSSSSMARALQERLVRFLEAGGRLLLLPVVPTHDENLEPCRILADGLGGAASVRNPAQYSRVDVAGVPNVYSNGDVYFLDPGPPGGERVGVDSVSGKSLAVYARPPAGGEVLLLGLRWSHAKREHEAMLTRLLRRLGLRPRIEGTNPNVWMSLRSTQDRSALFVMNLTSSPMETEVACRPSWARSKVRAGRFRLPAMTVRVKLLRKP